MALSFGGLFKNQRLFSISPNDFDMMHWEGNREVPGAAGSIITTSFTDPGTCANDAAVGVDAWDNPTNAEDSDNTYADCTHSATIPWVTNYLKATNFSFTIPLSATILGIEVQIENLGDFVGEIRDKTVKLVDENGNVVGDNRASATSWNTSESYYPYGEPSDLWGNTWTAADINNANFGVVLSAEIYSGGGNNTLKVDNIQIKVTYQT